MIGRSRIEVDNYESVVSEENHIRIKEIVNDFIKKNQIRILPVDVVSIATKCKWIVVPYSKVTIELKDFYEEIMYTDWGFTIEYNEQYFIFYNDSIKIGSQRFTIAHEIGHIVLEHFLSSDATTREKEANLFASRLLMPLNVLNECKVQSKKEIEMLCGVSFTAASYRFEKLERFRTNRKRQNNLEALQTIEQFREFIENYKKGQKNV